MKKILMISFFNSTNIGDNAICDVLEKKLSQIAQIYKLDVSGRTLKLNNPPENNGLIKPGKRRFYSIKSWLSLRNPRRYDFAKELIKKCDLVLLCGGNMIMDLEKFSYYSYLCNKYINIAKHMKKKTAFSFVGVGKIRTVFEKNRWKKAIRSCDFISVRDSISAYTIQKVLCCRKKIHVWKDPVFLLETNKKSRYHNTIGINIYLDSVKNKDSRNALKSTYVYWTEQLKKQHNVVLYTTELTDREGLYEVYNALSDTKNVAIISPNTLPELLSLYECIDAVIATRMHSFIIALTQCIPAVVLSWDKKINGVAQDIDMADLVYEIRNVQIERDTILKTVNCLVEENRVKATELYPKNIKIKSDFQMYFDMINRI